MKGGPCSRYYRDDYARRSVRRVLGSKSSPGSGFTIIEVLIVLAVTGAMLISALLLINGKQQITAFNQSIRNIQTELQQTMNDVGSGYYPNNGNVTCKKGGSGLLLTTSAAPLGTNQDCILIGKVIQFAVGSGATDPEQYTVYTIAGLRGDSINQSVDLKSADATLVARGASASPTAPDITETKSLQYGLTVSKMYYNKNPASSVGAVALASSLGSLGQGDASQQTDVVPIPGSALHVDQPAAIDQINGALSGIAAGSPYVNPANGVQVCFNSGGTSQSGLISIGGAGRQGSVDLQIFSQADCT